MKNFSRFSILLLLVFTLTACSANTPNDTAIEGSSSEPSENSLSSSSPSSTSETSKEPIDEQSIRAFDFNSKTVLLNSGYEMPIMGLGTYSLSVEECINSVKALLEAGGRLIDTAYMYHNEEAVGQGVRESGIPRVEIFVTTKIYPRQFSNADKAIDDALENLDIFAFTLSDDEMSQINALDKNEKHDWY